MKFYTVLFISLFSFLFSNAQTLNVDNSFSSGVVSKTKFGANSPYLFTHMLDDNYQVIETVRDALYESDNDLVRFPGGSMGNFYRFNNTGYGLLTDEVHAINNAFGCPGGNNYCLNKDEDAPRNYIYDLIDLAEHKFTTTGKRTELLFVASILIHFDKNFDEMLEIENIADLDELDDAVTTGDISEDFRMRILENYNAYKLLLDDENIDVVGFEFGNELYFYDELTNLKASDEGLLNFPNIFAAALQAIIPNIEKMNALIDFYRRILTPIDPNLKIGMPVAGINHLGNMTNIAEVWNISIRDMVLDHVDALIHHSYVQVGDGASNNSNPNNLIDDDDNARLINIKENVRKYVSTNYDKSVSEFDEFFGLDTLDLDVWITEYNAKFKGGTIWDEWGNSLLQGIFLNNWMHNLSASATSSKHTTFAIMHSWAVNSSAFYHNMLGVTEEGGVIKRISGQANDLGYYLKSDYVERVNGTLTASLAESEFYTDAFYTNDVVEDSCPVEKLFIPFSNLRADDVSASLNFTNNRVIIKNVEYDIISSKMVGYKSTSDQNLFSTCGADNYDETEDNYDVARFDNEITLGANQIIEGYSTGTFEFIIQPVNQNCNLTTSLENTSNFVSLSLSPNPASKVLSLELSNDLSKLLGKDISIVNALGQLVASKKVSKNVIELDIKDFQKGIYFISIASDDKKNYVGTFVKE